MVFPLRRPTRISPLLATATQESFDHVAAALGACARGERPGRAVVPRERRRLGLARPAKDRSALAMRLNGLLASPGFQGWLEGEPLDVQRLLWTAEGKPRIAILSVAHLSDAERMLFVTLLLGILSNLYTSIIVTRLVYDYLFTRRRIERLSV